jgi:dTDP-glucose 4,6-dehydratase
LEVVKAICGILDEMQPSANRSREKLITFVTDRLGHDRRYAMDPSKIERELDWRPQFRDRVGKNGAAIPRQLAVVTGDLGAGVQAQRLGLTAQ